VGLIHPPAALLSPAHRPSAFGEACVTGSLLTLFLTAPLSGMCLIIGEKDVSCHQLMMLQVREGVGMCSSHSWNSNHVDKWCRVAEWSRQITCFNTLLASP
jgi:hypothetical protein